MVKGTLVYGGTGGEWRGRNGREDARGGIGREGVLLRRPRELRCEGWATSPFRSGEWRTAPEQRTRGKGSVGNVG